MRCRPPRRRLRANSPDAAGCRCGRWGHTNEEILDDDDGTLSYASRTELIETSEDKPTNMSCRRSLKLCPVSDDIYVLHKDISEQPVP
jgi:hypothetical protein